MENKESKQKRRKEMSNPIAFITENLCSYLLEKPNLFPGVNIPKKATNFIRTHKEKLKVQGEFSFHCRSELWNNCCKETGHKLRSIAFDMFKKDEGEDVSINAQERFLQTAAGWTFPVERIKIDNERCFLYLQRQAVMTMLIQQVLKNDHTNTFAKLEKDPRQRVFFSRLNQAGEEIEELSFYRVKLLEDILGRVFEYSKWTMLTEEEVMEVTQGKGENVVLQVQVISAASKPSINSVIIPSSKLSSATIRCGIVIDPITGKITKLKTKEYLSCRSNDMCLMAMHKYGVRVKDDTRFSTLMSRLGTAAVTVDLMEVRFSSPVQIIRSGKGSTKGAAFILYNSARLESLLRRFDEKVDNGDYEGLPPIDSIDFTLLDEEVSAIVNSVYFYVQSICPLY